MNSWTGKPELTTAEDISNDGFWIDLKMADLMSWMRIPSEYDNDIIKRELITAMIDVNGQLDAVKAKLITSYDSLADYCTAHSQKIGDIEVLVSKYQQAVFCYAKAKLLPQFKTVNRKEEATVLAKEEPETVAYWYQQSAEAVQYFFSKFLTDTETGETVQPPVGFRASVI